jgi:hypothetical protein
MNKTLTRLSLIHNRKRKRKIILPKTLIIHIHKMMNFTASHNSSISNNNNTNSNNNNNNNCFNNIFDDTESNSSSEDDNITIKRTLESRIYGPFINEGKRFSAILGNHMYNNNYITVKLDRFDILKQAIKEAQLVLNEEKSLQDADHIVISMMYCSTIVSDDTLKRTCMCGNNIQCTFTCQLCTILNMCGPMMVCNECLKIDDFSVVPANELARENARVSNQMCQFSKKNNPDMVDNLIISKYSRHVIYANELLRYQELSRLGLTEKKKFSKETRRQHLIYLILIYLILIYLILIQLIHVKEILKLQKMVCIKTHPVP